MIADSAAAAPKPHERAGVGLALRPLVVVFVASVALFLFWDGPLWLAPPGASHVGRILVSYLAVVPLAALALMLVRAWSLTRFCTSVALVWGVKLIVTASLYPFLAPESASQYKPAKVPASARAPRRGPARSGYQPAPSPGPLSRLAGVVTRGDIPVAGAVVLVVEPPAGLPTAAPSELEWVLGAGPFGVTRLAKVEDRITVVNRDGVLHTLRASGDSGTLWHVPAPAGATASIPELAPGVYELGCANHADERAALVVVDHPYATVTDTTGRFELFGVPSGRRDLLVVVGPSDVTAKTITLAPNVPAEVALDVTARPRDEGK
jgi:hypothetical protein